jgi:mono/diheme cytochrome c family protein
MRHPGNKNLFAGCVALVLVGAFLSAAGIQEGPAKAKQNKPPQPLIASLKGPDLFREYCATCHGEDGRGNGPVAPALSTKPSDLTTISRRNGGVFPSQHIRTIISGDKLVLAHGSREMPIWGPIFHQVEWDQDYGDIRLQNVTKYLESIQQK